MQLIGTRAKPFLKWAGGKTQLLPEIQKRLPLELQNGTIKRYIEPFIGGGALFLYLAQNYNFDEIIVSDINDELLIVYKTICDNVGALIEELHAIKTDYFSSLEREKFFYEQRNSFNQIKQKVSFDNPDSDWIRVTTLFIFLNRTCFNGLYRTNSKSLFNVPFGKYSNPMIYDEANLRAVSDLLKKTVIRKGDFESCGEFTDEQTFTYFDPPYRPLSKTASFNTYHKQAFTDDDQTRLAKFYRTLDAKKVKLMLSNSDPKNQNLDDNFFDDLYKGFTIERVQASRAINSNGTKRGFITELLITNY
jgi:DNA adenine methylase